MVSYSLDSDESATLLTQHCKLSICKRVPTLMAQFYMQKGKVYSVVGIGSIDIFAIQILS